MVMLLLGRPRRRLGMGGTERGTFFSQATPPPPRPHYCSTETVSVCVRVSAGINEGRREE